MFKERGGWISTFILGWISSVFLSPLSEYEYNVEKTQEVAEPRQEKEVYDRSKISKSNRGVSGFYICNLISIHSSSFKTHNHEFYKICRTPGNHSVRALD